MAPKYGISSTSALVLLWCNAGCYPSRIAQLYLEKLDLASGISLYNSCNSVWPHYHEVIINRKFAVMELIKKSILENNELHQLVILGAGLAPLSLECRARFDNLEIFDIDLDNMEIKSKLASEADERMCGIKFITSDMENLYELQSALVKNGFKPGKPALVIAEGISYYVAAEALRNVLSFFKRAKASRFILDYLVPTQDISPDRQHIPDRIFELIRSQCNLPDIRRYKSADFESYFNTTVLQRLTMEDIEKIRKDKNTHFPSEASGWIEIGLLAV